MKIDLQVVIVIYPYIKKIKNMKLFDGVKKPLMIFIVWTFESRHAIRYR